MARNKYKHAQEATTTSTLIGGVLRRWLASTAQNTPEMFNARRFFRVVPKLILFNEDLLANNFLVYVFRVKTGLSEANLDAWGTASSRHFNRGGKLNKL